MKIQFLYKNKFLDNNKIMPNKFNSNLEDFIMKTLRNYLLVLTMVVAALSLSACGNNAENETGAATTQNETTNRGNAGNVNDNTNGNNNGVVGDVADDIEDVVTDAESMVNDAVDNNNNDTNNGTKNNKNNQ